MAQLKSKTETAVLQAMKAKQEIEEAVETKRTAIGTLQEEIEAMHQKYKEHLKGNGSEPVAEEDLVRLEIRLRAEENILTDLAADLTAAQQAVKDAENAMHLDQYQKLAEKRRSHNKAIQKTIDTLIDQMQDLITLDHDQRMCGLKLTPQPKFNRIPLNAVANFAIANLREFLPIEGHAYPHFRNKTINEMDIMTTAPEAPAAEKGVKTT